MPGHESDEDKAIEFVQDQDAVDEQAAVGQLQYEQAKAYNMPKIGTPNQMATI
jgi:hypothetical protein